MPVREARGFTVVRAGAMRHIGRMLVVYTLAHCSTCRSATAWLRAHGLEFRERPIRETPPSREEIRSMLALQGGDLRRLFNTSGQAYRAAGLKEALAGMSTDAAIGLLAANGSLVRRPFLIGPGVGLVGFDEKAWSRVLLARG